MSLRMQHYLALSRATDIPLTVTHWSEPADMLAFCGPRSPARKSLLGCTDLLDIFVHSSDTCSVRFTITGLLSNLFALVRHMYHLGLVDSPTNSTPRSMGIASPTNTRGVEFQQCTTDSNPLNTG